MPAIAFGRVWVGHCDTGTNTIVVDPNTNQVVGYVMGGSLTPAMAFGSLWINSNSFDTLLRIDPSSYAVTASIKVAGGTVSTGAGFLWVADVDPLTGDYSGLISKVDPAANRVVGSLQTAPVGAYPSVTFAFGALWLKGSDNDRLLRVDVTSGSTRTYTIPHFSPLSQFFDVVIATDSTSLWMRTSDDTVSQFDPVTGHVVATYPADPNGGGGIPALGFGSLWVTNGASDTVWRDRISS